MPKKIKTNSLTTTTSSSDGSVIIEGLVVAHIEVPKDDRRVKPKKILTEEISNDDMLKVGGWSSDVYNAYQP